MIKTSGTSATAVKGRAANILLDAKPNCLRISNISDRGMTYLMGRPKIQIEFIMMSTKVMFISTVYKREQNSILVHMPTSLVSIERRKNARYASTEQMGAYLGLSLWRPSAQDITVPPLYPHYANYLGNFITIADVSLGGFCGVTRFPSINSVLRRGLIDDRAEIIMPMQTPVQIGVEVRWMKKIKEHTSDANGDTGLIRSYRFGFEFINETDEAISQVRTFIQQLSQAGAI
jgi:hypothetical protein